MSYEKHVGPLFEGAEDRIFAYQDEQIQGGGWIRAFESSHKTTHTWKNRDECLQYQLHFSHHTNHAVMVELSIEDMTGKKIVEYEFTGSFGELCNRIFAPGCMEIKDNELPRSK